MLKALQEYRWASDEFAIASVGVRCAELSDRLGIPLQRWEVDGLGWAVGGAYQAPSGRVFVLQELEHAVRRLGARGPDVYVDATDVVSTGVAALVDEVLSILQLRRDELTWVQGADGAEHAASVVRVVEARRARRGGA